MAASILEYSWARLRTSLSSIGSSLVAGIKMLFGADPKQDYKDKVAEVHLK